MTDERKVWERQDAETDAAWAAFVAFRDTPPAQRKVGEHTAWSSRHAWRERVAAWDIHVDRATEDDRIDDARAMHVQHAELARDMLRLAVIEIRKRLARARAMPNASTIAVRDLIDLAEKAVRLERLAVGESESRNELSGTWAEIVAKAAMDDGEES